MTTFDIDNLSFQDTIDVRDLIARAEELESEMRGEIPDGSTWQGSDEAAELAALMAILADLKGNGGDEQWRGDWYPVTLIRDSYFRDYAQELAEECGLIPDDAKWPMTCIDWDQAARELRMDYTSTEIAGVTFWFR